MKEFGLLETLSVGNFIANKRQVPKETRTAAIPGCPFRPDVLFGSICISSPVNTNIRLVNLMKYLVVVADSLTLRVKLAAKTPNANSQIRGGSRKKEVLGDL